MSKQQSRGGWLFVLVAAITAIAALVPLLRERPVNVTLLAVAGFWLVVALIVAGRARAGSNANRN